MTGEGEDQQPGQALPATYYLIPHGLLYYYAQPCNLLVDPHSKTDVTIHFTYNYLLGCHIAAQNTIEKLHDHFHWPGMEAKVWCSHCPSPHGEDLTPACLLCRTRVDPPDLAQHNNPSLSSPKPASGSLSDSTPTMSQRPTVRLMRRRSHKCYKIG